jgi:hypothetical protein
LNSGLFFGGLAKNNHQILGMNDLSLFFAGQWNLLGQRKYPAVASTPSHYGAMVKFFVRRVFAARR